MKFFYWNKNFEIGISEIDRQHRRLVDLINALAAVITDGGKLPEIQSLISQMMDYAAVHFTDEERLLEASPLSQTDKDLHRKAHRGFVEKAQEIFHRTDLHQAETAEQVLEFLTTWLISHILGADMKIAQSLSPAAKQGPPEQSWFDVSPVERVLIGALSETERRFRLISDHTPALIWVSDSTGVRGFYNKAWMDFTGVAEEAVQTADWADFIHPEDLPAYRNLIAKLLTTPEPAEAEYRLRRFNGGYIWVLERILPRLDTNEVFMGLIASATDISAIKQAEALLSQSNKELEQEVARRTAQLEQLMLTDPLTGIGNRRLLIKRLDEETVRAHRYQRPLTAIFFDLDHFKRVNDTHGHAAGDALLIRVAETLKSNLRECDLLGRFGGEEFIVLLIETGLEAALSLAERMRTAIAGIRLPDMEARFTASAGLAELRPGETGEILLQRSDRALYLAKADGRNCCRVEEN
jgi:diguanylate cyclase (GGDEF)-like protein/hemerythrin-like metal-binding protein/PAS domain S-box-containing protein